MCEQCKSFDWADEQRKHLFSDVQGPVCKCMKATVQRQVKKEGPSKGKKFWTCAAWPKGCKFFQFQEPEQLSPLQSSSPSPHIVTPTKKRPPQPGFASYLADWKIMQLLQQMMHVDPVMMKSKSGSTYDTLQVVGAWKITNPSRLQKYEEAMTRERNKVLISKPPVSPLVLSDTSYTTAMNALGLQKLDATAGEVMLLHGTKPDKLHSILFEGLDPSVAADGLFGRGVYFAENAAKIDQYAVVDRRYSKEGDLRELHEKIYTGSNLHPGNVLYCLISRVLTGKYVTTKDGARTLPSHESESSRPLFTDETRSAIVPFGNGTIPSSLIAEPGGQVQTFREFIVFNPDQIFVEYLVAYQRVRTRCDCGKPTIERTVTKEGPNRGRKILFCCGDEEKCSFFQMLPMCHCGKSADIATSQSTSNPGKRYFRCWRKSGRGGGGYGDSCDFFKWADNFSSPPGSPYKRMRQSEQL